MTWTRSLQDPRHRQGCGQAAHTNSVAAPALAAVSKPAQVQKGCNLEVFEQLDSTQVGINSARIHKHGEMSR